MLIYRTAGGGGWKDRLDRPVEAVERDVAFGLVSAREGARRLRRGARATRRRRDRGRAGAPAGRARRRAGVRLRPAAGRGARGAARPRPGLPAPAPAEPLRWSPLEDADAARARVREAWEAEMAAGDGHAG